MRVKFCTYFYNVKNHFKTYFREFTQQKYTNSPQYLIFVYHGELCNLRSFKYSNWLQVNNDIVLKEPIYKSVIWICIHVFSSDNRILTTRKNRWWFTTVLCFAFHFFLIDIFHWLHEMLTCQSRSNCNAKCPSIKNVFNTRLYFWGICLLYIMSRKS